MKISTGKFFVSCLFLLSAVSFSAAQKTLSAAQFYERGLAKIKLAEAAGDFEAGVQKYREAVENFGKAIELNSREAKFYLKRGACFDALFEPEKAVADFNKAVELRPDYAEAFIARAKIYATYFEEDGQPLKGAPTALKDSAKAAKALADFNRAVEINPKNAAAYIARANFYFVPLEDYKAALADYTRAVEVEPRSSEALLERAGFYFRVMENHAKALADCTAAIRLKPRRADGYELRADIYSAIRENAKAIADYTAVLKLDANNVDALFNRANVYYRMGKSRLAEADERKAEKLSDAAPTESRVATLVGETNATALTLKKVSTERELLDSYIEPSKKAVEFVSVEPEGSRKEIERLTKILQADSEFADGFFERGRAYARLGEYDAAIADFSRVIALDPNDYHAFSNRGVACARSGNYERAIADFARASTINPREPSSLYNFGLALLNKGSFLTAANMLTGYLEKEPNDVKAYRLRAQAFRKLGKTSEAEADEKTAEKLEGNK